MMYLSRLMLDPRNARARRDLGNVYDMHRSLTRAFASDNTTSVSRFLWRLEADAAWAKPQLLVQSAQEPDWAVLQVQTGYLRQAPEQRQIDMRHLVAGIGSLRFRLRANPTVTRNERRQGLLHEPQQIAWLQRQGERHGFTVEQCLVTDTCRLEAGDGKGTKNIVLLQACFEGFLRVDNTERLHHALLQGIGPGKAFGCGLLSLPLS